MTAAARKAALEARLDTALDRVYRWSDGTISSTRDRLEADAYGARVVHVRRDGRRTYGLIERADMGEALADASPRTMYPGADHPMQALTWAPYTDTAKLIFDYAEHLPMVITSPDDFEYLENAITRDDEAHLFGSVTA